MTEPDTGSSPVSTAARVVAVDTGARDLAAAEHLAHDIDHALAGLLTAPVAASYVLSTHVVRTPAPHLVAVLSWSEGPAPDDVIGALAGLPGLREGADALPAVVEHRDRRAGRLVRYPGRERVERRTTAGAVVAESCVDEVAGLAGVSVGPDTELDCTGFARPTWRDGRCVLLVQQARHGLVPFEVREQVACCADH